MLRERYYGLEIGVMFNVCEQNMAENLPRFVLHFKWVSSTKQKLSLSCNGPQYHYWSTACALPYFAPNDRPNAPYLNQSFMLLHMYHLLQNICQLWKCYKTSRSILNHLKGVRHVPYNTVCQGLRQRIHHIFLKSSTSYRKYKPWQLD